MKLNPFAFVLSLALLTGCASQSPDQFTEGKSRHAAGMMMQDQNMKTKCAEMMRHHDGGEQKMVGDMKGCNMMKGKSKGLSPPN